MSVQSSAWFYPPQETHLFYDYCFLHFASAWEKQWAKQGLVASLIVNSYLSEC